MYVHERTIMGTCQDWVEEETEYSEPVGAVRGVRDGIPEHMKYMFDRAVTGVAEHEVV